MAAMPASSSGQRCPRPRGSALHDLADDTFLPVMNRSNVVIFNPAFLTLFVGAPVLDADGRDDPAHGSHGRADRERIASRGG